MSYREQLAPYIDQRLPVEGILIDIQDPKNKNKYQHNMVKLVFASLVIPHQDIELDHVVIAVPKSFVYQHQLQLFNKYAFTAKVGTYYKRKKLLGMYANSTAYHLQKINGNKFSEIERTVPSEISPYLINRLNELERFNSNVDIVKLTEKINQLPEGDREQYIENIKMTMQKKK